MAIDNYVLGKGKVYFDPFTSGTTTKTGERFLGNVPEFNLSIESEKLDHYSSKGGLREKDRTVTLEVNRSATITVDDISAENVALWFTGSVATITDAGLSNQTQAIADAVGGRYYQIGTSVNPAGLRGVTIDSVMAGATPVPVTTGYTLDSALGRIYIVPGGPGDGQDLTVTFDTAASTRTQISTGASAEVEGALRFISDNPEGDQRDFYMPYVRLSSNGDFSLIGDDWQSMGFNVEVLKLNDSTAAIYVDGRAA